MGVFNIFKQVGKTIKKIDDNQKAKPVGYRYTDALAKKLKISPNARPTKAHVEKYLGNGIYKEVRANRSDKNLKNKI